MKLIGRQKQWKYKGKIQMEAAGEIYNVCQICVKYVDVLRGLGLQKKKDRVVKRSDYDIGSG